VLNIAERIRHKIAESSITDGDEVIKVTVSIGGVSYPQIDVEKESNLVDRADQALYQAKESGRNCVNIASGA
jgi:two-component system, cell cycle response regulator